MVKKLLNTVVSLFLIGVGAGDGKKNLEPEPVKTFRLHITCIGKKNHKRDEKDNEATSLP